ncbi:MAG: response regulator [Methanobacterium sp.]
MITRATGSIKILLVEDNPGDVRLITEAFKNVEATINIVVAKDGFEAMQILKREGNYTTAIKPQLIVLDLNLPKKNGREVLKEIKSNPELQMIPVIILTTSSAEEDIIETYKNHVNAYITKPFNLEKFIEIVKSIYDFWLKNVKLPL